MSDTVRYDTNSRLHIAISELLSNTIDSITEQDHLMFEDLHRDLLPDLWNSAPGPVIAAVILNACRNTPEYVYRLYESKLITPFPPPVSTRRAWRAPLISMRIKTSPSQHFHPHLALSRAAGVHERRALALLDCIQDLMDEFGASVLGEGKGSPVEVVDGREGHWVDFVPQGEDGERVLDALEQYCLQYELCN